MKKLLILCCCWLLATPLLRAQSNNALSIYEGERIQSIHFAYTHLPPDSLEATSRKQAVEDAFLVYPYTHFNEFQTTYYLSQVKHLPFVQNALFDVQAQGDGSIRLVIRIELKEAGTATTGRTKRHHFLAVKFAASEMAYSNGNAWFAQPAPLLNGNPLAEHPVGKGYTGWVEGFCMGGLYGITRILPRWNLHLYAGASYIVSFSAGRELFTDRSRFHGEVEDAFGGIIGGKRLDSGHDYSYTLLYGRKQFVLGNGWLIINTSMNGQERAALQINPRWAARSVLQASFRWNNYQLQLFQVKPNELPIFYSRTLLNGVNVELGSSHRAQLGATVIHAPRSDVNYFLPDGSTRQRKGLWVYNLRFYGNPPQGQAGLFYKAEGGYQTNRYFRMRAVAGYAQAGWNFATTPGRPALSYRFAYFSGDNPHTQAYERWDALYTGGNGEQWVQGSNMYKMVQNSNEMTHLLQLIYSPLPKIQTVTQLWAFIAPQTNNLGGNPALSVMQSHYYGTELNVTLKYFHSRHWYFHLNTALTLPGNAIKDIVPGTRSWFSLMAFARYSL
ncbi:MAG: alginate export family protein [Bacteroides sp.]